MNIATQIRARVLILIGLLLGASGWFFWPPPSIQTDRSTIQRESTRAHAPAGIPNRTSHQGRLVLDHSQLSAILELFPANEHKAPSPPPMGAEWLQEDDLVLAGFSRWVDDFQLASPARQAWMLPDGLEQALVRREVMAALIATDPAKAIASAMPSHLRGGLPPAIQDLLEHRVTGVGDLKVIGILRDTERARFSPLVERNVLINGRRYQAYVHDAMESLGTASEVLMDGIALDNQLALTSQPGHWLEQDVPRDPTKDLIANHPLHASPGFVELGDKIYCGCCFVHTTAASGQNTGDGTAAAISRAYANLGSRTMLVIPVEFQDTTGSPWSSSSIQTDRTDKLKSYCNTVSYGKLTLATTVSPLQQVDQNATYYTQTHDGKQGYTVLSEHATAKANTAGYDHNTYDFACIVINHNLYSGWAGRGQVGKKISWVDGPSSGQDQEEEVYIHEIGHNFGLWHANSWDPNTLVPDDSDGTHVEYGHEFDAMGDTWTHDHDQLHYNASFKNALDWLPSSQITDISATATLTLHAMDRTLVAGRTYAIRIPTSFTLGSNSNLDYWIEARSRYPSVSSVDNGVLLYVTDSSHTDEALKLLDMVPATSSVNDAGLTVGSSFSTKDNKWKITVNSVSGSGADRAFNITVADARPPSITTQPSDVSVTVDGAATFSVTATGSADETLQYQWHKDSIAIAGATSATYTISNSVLADAGSYHVVVTNSYGTATSNSVTLTVNEDTGGGGGGCGSMPPVNLLLFIGLTLLANRILLGFHCENHHGKPLPLGCPGLHPLIARHHRLN